MGQENSVENKAAELLRLHQDPTLLTVVNVWDSIIGEGGRGHARAPLPWPPRATRSPPPWAIPTARRSRST